MLRFAPWKLAIIAAICLVGLAFAAPNLLTREQAEDLPGWLPNQQINLGLDLRGGSYLLLEVDTDAVVSERLQNLLESVRTVLREDRIGYTRLEVEGDQVVVQLRDPAQLAAARAKLDTLAEPAAGMFMGAAQAETTLSLDEGSATFRLGLTEESIQRRVSNAVMQSIEIVRRRLDETGVVEPTIQRQGADRVLVQLPGVGDPERIKALLGTTAKMTFHLVRGIVTADDERAPPGTFIVPSAHAVDERGNPLRYILNRRVEVSGENLSNANPGTDQRGGGPAVFFTFDSTGTRQFARVTQENVGRPFAIVLDDKVITAPNIREPILGGSGQISGGFTFQEAADLAVLLRAGALPAPLEVVEERTVGPDLGADAIEAGEIAIAVGGALVVVYMIAMYGLFGLFAALVLVVNLVLIMGILSMLQATLTLPGIAGMLLTIGMAVDAAVLIFERVREEARLGKSPIAAMDAGFSRAFGTIIDSQVTTLLAMVLLFALGSGPVRGFAVTISIGILTSLFTSIWLLRLIMVSWLRRRRPTALPV